MDCPDLAQAFRNMIEDPIVDSFLSEKYNFNLLIKYKKDLRLFKRELDQLDKEPTDKIRKLKWIINVTRLLRCWNLIKNLNRQKEWIDYKTTLKTKCPIIWKDSVEFCLFIEENGLDTKERQIKIMKEFDHRNRNDCEHKD